MRRLMWFTIGLGAACAWGAYGLNAYWMWLALGSVGLALPLLVLSLRFRWLRAVVSVLLGCAIGLCWFRGFDAVMLTQARNVDDQTYTGPISITDYPEQTSYGSAVDGKIALDGKRYKTRLYLDEITELSPGDTVSGTFLLRASLPGGQAESDYNQGNGVFLIAYQQGDTVIVQEGAVALTDWPVVLRSRIKAILDQCFSGETVGFARALLLGDTDQLSYDTDTALKVSGIRHIVAVSGLHVSILFTMLTWLLGRRRRWLTAVLELPALLLFAAVAGFTPSVNRACIMQGLMLVALVADREYDPQTALSFAALVMLLYNPLVIKSVSFQLSFGCVAGILLLAPGIQKGMLSTGFLKAHKGRAVRYLTGSVSVSLGSMVLTTPLCAWYFGMVSLVGVVTNLLTLPVVTITFYGIFGTAALGALWLPAGKLLGMVVAIPIQFVLWVARTCGKIPMAAVYTQSFYIVLWLIFVYVLLSLFLLGRGRKPGLLLCCCLLGMCAAQGASWLEMQTWDSRVTVLDVGQGQCILLQNQGRTYLVDCGGDSDKAAADLAAQTLLSQGIQRLDGVILTHFDRDHSGGMEYLLSRIPTEVLFLPDGMDENQVAQTLTPWADQTIWVSDLVEMTCGDMAISLYPGVLNNSSNDSSLAVLFQSDNCAILITGDRSDFGERRLIADYQIPDVDVYIVGHHGSASSSCQELLDAVTPEIAIISVGQDNGYGHPSQEVLDRLTAAGCGILRTDRNGTICYIVS